MLYEFRGTLNGTETSASFRAETEAEAFELAAEWFGHRDIWCVARWTQE